MIAKGPATPLMGQDFAHSAMENVKFAEIAKSKQIYSK